jgi:bifunctional DNA-binding transcriptional regulator/antitoxin component of YhaV-PrlF toxin-antitoxin module
LPNDLAIGNLLVMRATVTVDEVGRLVLPKPIRDAIGVCGRMTVQVEVVNNAAQITALEPAARTVARKRGRLVFTGALPGDWDSGEAVVRMRERRLHR